MTVTTSVPEPTRPNTRETRALELYRTRGHEIERVGEDVYLVPSCTGRGFYEVNYAGETCDCPDFLHRRNTNCKHILAVGIRVAKRRRPRPCICYEGLVFIGHLETTEESEEIEVVEAVPCRRCAR